MSNTPHLKDSHPFHKTQFHRLPHADATAAPTLFWPVVTLLLSAVVAMICWGLYDNLPQLKAASEKHLRQAFVWPKFNLTSAEASHAGEPELLPEPELIAWAVTANATAEPPLLPPALEFPGAAPLPIEPPLVPPKMELPKVDFVPFGLPLASPPVAAAPVAAAPVPVPPSAPFVPATERLEPAKLKAPELPIIPAQVADSNPLVYRESTSGDTPMLRNWKTLALYSLMTTAVVVQVPVPVVADDKDAKEKEKTLLERLTSLQETIKTSFEDVKTDIAGVKAEITSQKSALKKIEEDGLAQRLRSAAADEKIKNIESALDKIRTDLDALRSRDLLPKPALDKASVEEIKAKLGAIEQAILKLQPSTSRIALSPPAASSTGRVVLVNLYPEELLFIVNQKRYRVAPGSNMPVENVPAGALSYEVISGIWGSRANVTTSLAANETFTLTAR